MEKLGNLSLSGLVGYNQEQTTDFIDDKDL